MNDIRKEYVKFFRQSSPYIHAHHGKTFVITLGGDALAHENLTNIINDIALLSSLGVRMVLVYGARPQIESRLKEKGLKSELHNGRRITDKQSLECVMDAVGNLRAMIESRLSSSLVNSPMQGASIRVVSGNFVTAKPLGVLDGHDFQHTGGIRRIDNKAIHQLLDNSYIVLLPCLGLSPSGQIFNLEVEDLATYTAIHLKAEKLILFGSHQGLTDENNQLISNLPTALASKHLRQLEKSDHLMDLKRLLSSATDACMGGVERAQMINFEEDGSLLLELFTRDGMGTMVSRDRYEAIRAATIEDVTGILELIRPLEEKGILRRRSRKELEREIRLFRVIDLDGTIIGCATIRPFHGEKTAELACLVVHPEYRKDKRGDVLLEAVVEQARLQKLEQIFVLTTQTIHWFLERGFKEVNAEELPVGKRKHYNVKRQSKILVLPI